MKKTLLVSKLKKNLRWGGGIAFYFIHPCSQSTREFVAVKTKLNRFLVIDIYCYWCKTAWQTITFEYKGVQCSLSRFNILIALVCINIWILPLTFYFLGIKYWQNHINLKTLEWGTLGSPTVELTIIKYVEGNTFNYVALIWFV